MIKKTDILYIYQEFKYLIIETKYGKEVTNKSFEEFITPYCLAYLTTLKGRIDAIKIKYSIRKYVPIFIDRELVLFPTSNLKDLNNIYLNAYNIKRILETDNKKAKVVFQNNHSLILNKPFDTLDKYYQRALKIDIL